MPLCRATPTELPLAARRNAVEAQEMVDKAREKNLVLMEAAHWYYHPFRQRMQEVIASGVLGEVQHVYSNFCSPGKPGQPLRDTEATMQKIRYSSELAGGSMMDQGWYALNCVRTLMGRQLPEVVSATAQKWPFDEEIDEGMKASLQFGDGV